MLLSELVTINEKGIVASAVNFGMMESPETNLRLCEGFIFNYNSKKPEVSTVGILDLIRRSYYNRNSPNIHLIVQQYGKGKSHFAVVVANYFKKQYNSPEVEGILHQIQIATNGKSEAIAEGLNLYKRQEICPHLVLCLSGDRGGDLKKQFLQTLLKSLDEAGVEDSVAQHTCRDPLRYLEGLNELEKEKAEEYLRSINKPDGDVDNLIRLLKDNNPSVILTVKEIFKEITGFAPDFSAEIDVEAILKDLIENLCSGDNPRFAGVLILFDELNYYLQSWAADQIGAGGTALQNITNICEKYKGKIALLGFTQISLKFGVGISASIKDSYFKLSSRLEPQDSTYHPESSLELVLDKLIISQDKHLWEKFINRWQATLIDEGRKAYERIKIYREKGWQLDDFYRHLSEGCFPIHPLTAYLLCNLDFTQDRTAIQFIKSYVKDFLARETSEKEGKLNYIYAVALVDNFGENFANSPIYRSYQKAVGLVAGSDNPDELTIVKALFLYYASREKLAKPDQENHEEILSSLTGLSKLKVKSALENLIKIRDIVYYKKETKLYIFYEGFNPGDLEKELEEEIKRKNPSIRDLIIYTSGRIKDYLRDTQVTATDFVNQNRLVAQDWTFEYKIYDIEQVVKILSNQDISRETQQKGLFAYVLGETQEDLAYFRCEVSQYLENSPIKEQIVIAIPNEEVGDLPKVLLKKKTLENKDNAEKRRLGTAYYQLLQRLEVQLKEGIENILNDCTYHSIVSHKINTTEQKQPTKVISALLADLYPLVPPVESIEKMRSNHPTGGKIVAWVARQLLKDYCLNSNTPDTSYQTVIQQIFISAWGLIKREKYTVQEPTNERIKAAWDKISHMTNLDGLPERIISLKELWQTLSNPPYGYNELTFMVLLAAWLTYHPKEIVLRGVEKLPTKKTETVTIKTQRINGWAESNIWQKPQDFVNKWIITYKAQLIRRQPPQEPTLAHSPATYEQAQQYLRAVADFLDSAEIDKNEREEITKKQKQVNASLQQIENWFKPVEEVENLSDSVSLETLIRLYPQLTQNPPAINLTAGAIAVIPSQQQRKRQAQALGKLTQKLETTICQKNQTAQLSTTENECDTYKQTIQRYLSQIEPIDNFPPHLIEYFRNGLQLADRIKGQIQEQTKINQCFSQIQQLYDNLSSNATQQDYIQTAQQIDILSRDIPYDSELIAQVQQIQEYVQSSYRELNELIEIWTAQASETLPKKEILDLTHEITRRSDRFTEIESKNQIKLLQERLSEELLKVEEKENEEEIKYKQDQGIIEQIRHLKVTKNISINQCRQNLDNIASLASQLNNPKIFSLEIKQISDALSHQIEEYKRTLNNLQYRLSTVNSLKSLEKIKSEYDKLYLIFQESIYEENYQQFSLRIKEMTGLLEIADAVTNETVEDCENKLEKLREWREKHQTLSNELLAYFQSICQQVEQSKNRLIEQKRQEATTQIKNLGQEVIAAYEIADDIQRLNKFAQILVEVQKIKDCKNLLELNQQQVLQSIEQECKKEECKSKSNQIITLFRQLPKVQKQTLYEQLAQYLSDGDL